MSDRGRSARHFSQPSGLTLPTDLATVTWIKPDPQNPTRTTSRQWPGRVYEIGGNKPRTIVIAGNPATTVLHLDDLLMPMVLFTNAIVAALVCSDQTITFLYGGKGKKDHRYVGVLYEDEVTPAFLIDSLQPLSPIGLELMDIAVDATGRLVQIKPAMGPSYVWDTWGGGNTTVQPLDVAVEPA